MKTTLRLLPALLAAAFAFVSAPAFAQHSGGAHTKSMLPQMCETMCYGSLKVCDSGVAPDDPTCLTRRVVCAQSCQPCLNGREECGTSGGGDFKSCLSEYGACSRKMTDEGAPKHPLVAFRGGDGGSKEQAVLIAGAADDAEALIAQGIWAQLRQPTWKQKDRKQVKEGDKAFDLVDFDTPGGVKQVWFGVAPAAK